MNHELVRHYLHMPGVSLLEAIAVLFIHWLYFSMFLFMVWCIVRPFFGDGDESPEDWP